ncbi:ferredoxin [Nakamurella sp. A5-74]|uniref:Ferredoxin n=1 Tax=Nakamurella sp. A5-74 TaxID=3158264 RepID=A0AAU8DRF5_9ACTN
MEIVINKAACEGHGLCELTAPQIYGLDEEGQAVLKQPVDESNQAAAEAGARVCPVAAIEIRR